MGIFSIISNLFDTVSVTFDILIQSLLNFVSSLTYMVSYLNYGITIPAELSSYVHPILGSCVLCVVGVSTIKVVLGWGNG